MHTQERVVIGVDRYDAKCTFDVGFSQKTALSCALDGVSNCSIVYLHVPRNSRFCKNESKLVAIKDVRVLSKSIGKPCDIRVVTRKEFNERWDFYWHWK